MGQLDGKIALVTAGGGGIGQATAILLAERGAQVVAADIDPAGLEETFKSCNAPERLRTVIADVTTPAGAESAVRAATGAFGGLSILVNVVGGSRPGKTVVDLTLEEWDGWRNSARPSPSCCPTMPPIFPERPCRSRAGC